MEWISIEDQTPPRDAGAIWLYSKQKEGTLMRLDELPEEEALKNEEVTHWLLAAPVTPISLEKALKFIELLSSV